MGGIPRREIVMIPKRRSQRFEISELGKDSESIPRGGSCESESHRMCMRVRFLIKIYNGTGKEITSSFCLLSIESML
jgi:hypothetical protein